MPCTKIQLPGGGVAIVCSRGKTKRPACSVCGRPDAALLCDGGPHACDVPICKSCAVHRDPDHDYCPRCAASRGLPEAERLLLVVQDPSGYHLKWQVVRCTDRRMIYRFKTKMSAQALIRALQGDGEAARLLYRRAVDAGRKNGMGESVAWEYAAGMARMFGLLPALVGADPETGRPL